MQKCPNCGHTIWEKTRSNQQNRYYFGVVLGIFSNDLGYSKDEMHDILRSKFLSKDINVCGDIIRVVRSTASLTTVEFNEYIDQCVRFGAEQGLNIPEPCEELKGE